MSSESLNCRTYFPGIQRNVIMAAYVEINGGITAVWTFAESGAPHPTCLDDCVSGNRTNTRL